MRAVMTLEITDSVSNGLLVDALQSAVRRGPGLTFTLPGGVEFDANITAISMTIEEVEPGGTDD